MRNIIEVFKKKKPVFSIMIRFLLTDDPHGFVTRSVKKTDKTQHSTQENRKFVKKQTQLIDVISE